ncbi:integrator complex subunit 1-like [Tubulanus polymorphus]|uniref:integrator complex subunit 1-like n=1 Tax=Tubulanus polymorphus TaxID=672921 RepID=UPI003DA20552
MERGKPMTRRPGGKQKGHLPPGDLIALGSKPRSSSEVDLRPPSALPKKAGLTSGMKREKPAQHTCGSAAKRPKLLGSQTFTPLGRPDTDRRGSPAPQTQTFTYENAIDVDPQDLYNAIESAEETGDDVQLEGLLCGAVKHLRNNRTKPNQAVFLTLMCLAKTRQQLFDSDVVIEAMCSLLKRDVGINFKTKGNALVPVLVCNVLMAAFQEEENWPDQFLKVYIEDSLGERIWVDREDCQGFVDNIQSAFDTKLPPKSENFAIKPAESSSSCSSPIMFTSYPDEEATDSDTGDKTVSGGASGVFVKTAEELKNIVVFPRYIYQQTVVENFVVDTIKEHLTRRGQGLDNISRNFLKLMIATCGYNEVRVMAAQRLEMWLQNPKLTRPAQELLMSVCMNCGATQEILAQIIKIRMKTKPLINHYLGCIREIIIQAPVHVRSLLTHTIYNELSSARNPNNMGIISVVFQHTPDTAAKILAEIFQDFLINRDDYLRALRALLREIVRTLKYDMNFAAFVLGLLAERSEPKFADLETMFKERLILSIVDLVCMTCLLSVTPHIKETITAYDRGDFRELATLTSFQQQIAGIQRDSVCWLHTIVPKLTTLKNAEFLLCLHKLVFLEKPEQYYNKDNWPTESERGLMIRAVSEVPVHEDTLMRIFIVGLSKDLPLNSADALELADKLVERAAALQMEGIPVLNVERLEFFDAVLNACTYHHPENIALPRGYQPPTLAISNLYWKAWDMLLVIAAFNPSTLGRAAWDLYPTLKSLMEMVMTNNYKFPPPTCATDDASIEEIWNNDRQLVAMEKQQILEFEGHLAAATSKVTITENNSLLISQLTSMDPTGPARKPPLWVIDQLKLMNKSLRIGHLLCCSREPDFLMDIIQRQGTSQSMPWLAELVESNEGSLEVLPVQCLCEFLLHESDIGLFQQDDDETGAQKLKKKQKIKKQELLLKRLNALLFSPQSDCKASEEVLDYFMKRLSNQQASSRALAVQGLSMVLCSANPENKDLDSTERRADDLLLSYKWLLNKIPLLTHFASLQPKIALALRQACRVEMDTNAISAYILFLERHRLEPEEPQQLADLCLDLAQLIVERALVMNQVLPGEEKCSKYADNVHAALINIFVRYIRLAKQPKKEAYAWSDKQDQILIQWENGDTVTLHILVVHAMIILLTYGYPNEPSDFSELLETWFPAETLPPSAFLVDTSEEALLLPDWLKLRLIRSATPRLVDGALQDLEASQLLLFVQSFGIPVSSMSKLLNALDCAVETDLPSVEENIVDKSYMAQLIDVQKLRGACGGDKFYSILTPTEEQPQTENWKAMPPKHATLNLDLSKKLPDVAVTFKNVASATKVVQKLFLDEDVAFNHRQSLLKDVQKAIMKNAKVCDVVLSSIHQILQSDDGRRFVQAFLLHTSISSPLLKIITTKQKPPSEMLTSVMAMLLDSAPNCSSPVICLAKRIVGEKIKPASSVVENEPVDGKKLTDGITELNNPRLEEIVKRFISDGLKDGAVNNKSLDVLFDHLKNTEHDSLATGVLVDWLELLDPDGKHPDYLDHSKRITYLLALLIHQSNWSTLQQCIDNMLKDNLPASDKCKSREVLDFLSACMHIPKIWQGCDKKVSKNTFSGDMLHLSIKQIEMLIENIAGELEREETPSA